MSSANSTEQSEHIYSPKHPQHSSKPICRFILGMSIGVAVVATGLSVGIRPYINRTLLPQVEDNLERTLNRPIEMGPVQTLLPWKVTVGATDIENLAMIERIDIRFNLLNAILTRELKVGLQLNQAEIVLTESVERGWNVVELNLDDTGGGYPLAELDIILQDSSVSLVPLEGNSLQITEIRGHSTIGLDDPPGPNLDFNLSASLESAPIQLEGTATLDDLPRVDVAIEGTGLPISIVDRVIPELPLHPQSGQLALDLQLVWESEQPPEVIGDIELKDGEVFLPQLDRTVTELNGQFNLDRQTVSLVDVTGQLGEVPFSTEGTLDWADVLDWGELRLPVATPPQEEESTPPNSSAFQRETSWVRDEHLLLASWYPAQPILAQSEDETTISAPQLDLTVTVPTTDISALLDVVGLKLPVPVAGAISSTFTVGGALDQPQIQGNFEAVEGIEVDRIQLFQLAGQFAIAERLLSLSALTASLRAGEVDVGQLSGSGTVQLDSPLQSTLVLSGNRLDLDTLVGIYDGTSLPFPLGTVDIDTTIVAVGTTLSATTSWTGDISGNGRLQVAEGTITIPQSQFSLGEGTVGFSLTSPAPGEERARTFQARLQPNNVPLSQFVAGQSGLVTGDIQLTGNTANLSLAGLRGNGPITLTQLADLPGSIAAQVDWDGTGITVSNGDVLGLIAISGRIPVNPNTLAIGSVNLSISATSLSLEELPDLLPGLLSGLPYRGLLDLEGQLTGSPDNLKLATRTNLNDLAFAGLQFSPLQGHVNWQASEGISLDLTGSSSAPELPPDRIAMQLGPNFTPQWFELRQGNTSAIGESQEELLQVELTEFPLALLTSLGPGYFSGTLDSTFAIDWANQTVAGNFLTEQPNWSGLQATRLQGDFAWDSNRLSLNNGHIFLENSSYSIDGAIVLPGNTVPAQVDLNLSTGNGSLEDLLVALDWQEWSDVARGFEIPQLGTLDDLATTSVSVLQRALYDRIFAYADWLEQWQTYLASQTDPRLPDLANLSGQFQGELRVVGLITNPVAQFDLRGQNWSLEEFQLEEVTASGRLSDRQLNPIALEVRTGDHSGSLQGTLGREGVSGSLSIVRAPIELLQRFVPQLPPFSGDLGVTANLGGTLQEPELIGQLQLERAQLNYQPLYSANGTVDYRSGQLSLDGTLIVDREDSEHPIALQGTVPLPIPFLAMEPPTNELVLAIAANDNGLKFVNLFSDQLQVQDVRGQLSAELRGTLSNPTLQGNLSLDSATADLGFLPAPLEQVQAQVSFNSDTIHVRSFRGLFGGEDITAQGFIPIVEPGSLSVEEEPLAVDIETLSIEWPDLYTGQVKGNLIVANSLLAPRISGNVVLSNGIVNLPSRQTETSVAAEISGPDSQPQFRFRPILDGLTISLAERVDVNQDPLFRFTTEGEITLYGPAEALQADGTIRLRRGVVTFGPAFLRLDRGWPNTVTFERNRGLDPDLNVRLVARATEASRGLAETLGIGARDFLFTDDLTGLSGREGRQLAGELQTLEVRATVQGPASQLATSGIRADIVELSSVPPRTEGELLTLLGASAAEGLLTNVLGATLSRSLFGGESRLADSLGLDEINIGTFVGEDNDTSLGVEASKDLVGNFSISGEASLTDDTENPRLGGIIRLTDTLILRGRSDFENDTRGSIELETRF